MPCDFRIDNRVEDGLIQNDHFRAMLQRAFERGFAPELVFFDGWYARLKNLKCVIRLKANRWVSVEGHRKHRPVSARRIPPHGQWMHLKGYGWMKGFKTVTPDGREAYWATSRWDMTLPEAADYTLYAWQIEVYPQGLKSFTGIERGPFRVAVAQRNPIGLAMRAFLLGSSAFARSQTNHCSGGHSAPLIHQSCSQLRHSYL